MNPLAKPLHDLLTAVWDDPKYKDVRDAAFEAHALHASEALNALKADERLSPILMMAAVRGFTPEEYEMLEKAIQPKIQPLRDKRAKEDQAAKAALELQMIQTHWDLLEMKEFQKALAKPTAPIKWKWRNKL